MNRFILTVVLCAGAMVFAGQPALAVPPVFINEIHYDNTGVDVGESVEIAGPAGTDLSTYALYLYNGLDGSVYNTVPLAGIIPNLQNGYGVLSFATLAIQNGAPDGLALVNGMALEQFLSYEGSFVGTAGPAATWVSTDIGVFQNGATGPGLSLQLVGVGTTYSDFAWFAGEQAQSFGAVNAGQTFVPEPVSLVLLATGLAGMVWSRRRSGRA